MDLFVNYFKYLNSFDILVGSVGALFLLIQILAVIPVRVMPFFRKIKSKKKIAQSETSPEQLNYTYYEIDKHRLKWVKGASILREMIGLLPFLGILGTVLGLLNTLETFKPGSGIEIDTIIKEFAPAMTSTISALIATIINMLVFNMVLLPPIIENEGLSQSLVPKKHNDFDDSNDIIDKNRTGKETNSSKEKIKVMMNQSIFSKKPSDKNKEIKENDPSDVSNKEKNNNND